jgi:hypothetical protein
MARLSTMSFMPAMLDDDPVIPSGVMERRDRAGCMQAHAAGIQVRLTYIASAAMASA